MQLLIVLINLFFFIFLFSNFFETVKIYTRTKSLSLDLNFKEFGVDLIKLIGCIWNPYQRYFDFIIFVDLNIFDIVGEI